MVDNRASSSPRRNTYPLAADTLGPEEIRAAKSVLDSGRMTMGERVRAFESEFAAWVGSAHAIMVNSGSSANLLIADALVRRSAGIPPLVAGDEILVPGLSWPTTVWPLVQLGFVPVFVDVDRETLGLDLDAARAALGTRTRAMVVIHPLGRALEIQRYRQFCEDERLVLIEDCCESLGAHSRGEHVGTTSVLASFSFYFSHHISTIEGGMVVTDDDSLENELRSLRAHGWIRDRSDREAWVGSYPEFDPRFLFATVGYNVRPTEIQAAIGTIQLRRLDEMLGAREALAGRFVELAKARAPWLELIGADTLRLPVAHRRDRTHSWMTLPMRVGDGAPMSRNEVVAHFESHGVETRPLIAGNLARHPATSRVVHRLGSTLEQCDRLLTQTLMIGCHPATSSESIDVLEAAVSALPL